MSREDDHRRVSALAGVDESGAILPPPPGAKLDDAPVYFWKNRKQELDACPLTPREIEAVKLFADGYSGKQAAHVMKMHHSRVGYLVSGACRAAGATNRTHLVSMALRKGWIE